MHACVRVRASPRTCPLGQPFFPDGTCATSMPASCYPQSLLALVGGAFMTLATAHIHSLHALKPAAQARALSAHEEMNRGYTKLKWVLVLVRVGKRAVASGCVLHAMLVTVITVTNKWGSTSKWASQASGVPHHARHDFFALLVQTLILDLSYLDLTLGSYPKGPPSWRPPLLSRPTLCSIT